MTGEAWLERVMKGKLSRGWHGGLEAIIARGNDEWSGEPTPSNRIFCRDGFSFSAIAHWGAYCTPRPDFNDRGRPVGPFSHLEIGFPSDRPQPWDAWQPYASDPQYPETSVYPYVPVELVRELVRSHGGEDIPPGEEPPGSELSTS